MATRSSRPWIKTDIGLLDDQDWTELPAALRGAWLTAYLIVARDGDSCKSRDRLAWLMQRNGIADAPNAVAALDAAGWLEDTPDGRVTIHRFGVYQPRYLGPSDLPDAKAERATRRPTTRAGRSSRGSVERGGASAATEERRGEENRRAAAGTPADAGAGARVHVREEGGNIESFGAAMTRLGFDPKRIGDRHGGTEEADASPPIPGQGTEGVE